MILANFGGLSKLNPIFFYQPVWVQHGGKESLPFETGHFLGLVCDDWSPQKNNNKKKSQQPLSKKTESLSPAFVLLSLPSAQPVIISFSL